MAERYIPEHRRTTFKAKNTFKPDELRRRREEQQVEIRKAKREENLAKRRGIASRDGAGPGASLGAAPDSDDEAGTIESQVSSSAARSTKIMAAWRWLALDSSTTPLPLFVLANTPPYCRSAIAERTGHPLSLSTSCTSHAKHHDFLTMRILLTFAAQRGPPSDGKGRLLRTD